MTPHSIFQKVIEFGITFSHCNMQHTSRYVCVPFILVKLMHYMIKRNSQFSKLDSRGLVFQNILKTFFELRTSSSPSFYVYGLTLSSLSTNPTKWLNTLKQFVGKLQTNCLSVFDHFVRLGLKRLRYIFKYIHCYIQ